MNTFDLLLSAAQSLRSNILRSVLTALGMIIGVGAVITMVAIGSGAQANIQKVIEGIGANMLTVQPGSARPEGGVQLGAGTRQTLTWQDAIAIQEIPEALAVAPSSRGQFQVIFGNTNWRTSASGITNAFMTVNNWSVATGRGFSDDEVENGAKIVMLGATVAKNLFPGQDPLGQVVRIDRVPFTIVGTLNPKGQSSFGQDQDDTMFVPLKAAQQRLLGGRNGGNPDSVMQIAVLARTSEVVDLLQNEIGELLRDRHRIPLGRGDDFTIRNVSQIFEARAESSRVMTLLLAAVAGVSLLVGGIGIMNIMLVSVTERTREIGVRMAIGARRRDVMSQFLIEAVALSAVGGIIGIILGAVGSRITAAVAGWPLQLSPTAILAAFGFAAAVGIFFGFYPARKASMLDPIEALRYD